MIATAKFNISFHFSLCALDHSGSLVSAGGVALIAAKRYYFGVGGSTTQFVQLLQEQASDELQHRVVKVIENGVSNLREIVEVTFRTSPSAVASATTASS